MSLSNQINHEVSIIEAARVSASQQVPGVIFRGALPEGKDLGYTGSDLSLFAQIFVNHLAVFTVDRESCRILEILEENSNA